MRQQHGQATSRCGPLGVVQRDVGPIHGRHRHRLQELPHQVSTGILRHGPALACTNPIDRRLVLLRLLHSRHEIVNVGAQFGDRLGSEEGHIGGAMLHHRPEQASVFLANLVDILLELLLRFLVLQCGTPLLAKQIRYLVSLGAANLLCEECRYDYCNHADSPRTTSVLCGVSCMRQLRGDGQDVPQRVLGCVRPLVKIILVVLSLRVLGSHLGEPQLRIHRWSR